LMKRQKSKTAVIDFDVQLIDRAVAVDDTSDRIHVAPNQAVDRGSHAILGKTAHLEQSCLELLEVGLKVSRGRF